MGEASVAKHVTKSVPLTPEVMNDPRPHTDNLGF